MHASSWKSVTDLNLSNHGNINFKIRKICYYTVYVNPYSERLEKDFRGPIFDSSRSFHFVTTVSATVLRSTHSPIQLDLGLKRPECENDDYLDARLKMRVAFPPLLAKFV